MSQNIRKLFGATEVAGLAPGLDKLVYARLEREQKRLAKRNLLAFGLADILSAAGLVAICLYLANLMASSSFYNYFSLLWSDGGAVTSYWQELVLSLVESLPILGLIAFLAVALAFLLSLNKTMSSFKSFYYQPS
ncbi:MAG: hypothetical protein WC640_03680 [Candidatus Paceibacterota bacterium]|jgi:hypothetical protein